MKPISISQKSLNAFKNGEPFNLLGVINEQDLKHIDKEYGFREDYIRAYNNFKLWEKIDNQHFKVTNLKDGSSYTVDYNYLLTGCKAAINREDFLFIINNISKLYLKQEKQLGDLMENDILITYNEQYIVKVVDKSDLKIEPYPFGITDEDIDKLCEEYFLDHSDVMDTEKWSILERMDYDSFTLTDVSGDDSEEESSIEFLFDECKEKLQESGDFFEMYKIVEIYENLSDKICSMPYDSLAILYDKMYIIKTINKTDYTNKQNDYETNH